MKRFESTQDLLDFGKALASMSDTKDQKLGVEDLTNYAAALHQNLLWITNVVAEKMGIANDPTTACRTTLPLEEWLTELKTLRSRLSPGRLPESFVVTYITLDGMERGVYFRDSDAHERVRELMQIAVSGEQQIRISRFVHDTDKAYAGGLIALKEALQGMLPEHRYALGRAHRAGIDPLKGAFTDD